MNGDPFPLLFSSIRLTTRSFFTARATRESEKHKKEEGDDKAPISFSLFVRRRRRNAATATTNHDDGEGGKTFRFVTTAPLSLEVKRKTNVPSSSIPFQVCSLTHYDSSETIATSSNLVTRDNHSDVAVGRTHGANDSV